MHQSWTAIVKNHMEESVQQLDEVELAACRLDGDGRE